METKFNFKSSVCTNKNQSERLLALGLKKETADMYITNMSRKGLNYTDDWQIGSISYCDVMSFWDSKGLQLEKTAWSIIPAWSMHRLLSMLPDYIVVNSSSGLNPNFYLNIRDGFVSYKDNRGFSYGSTSGNMYDAITRMISFLIKEGYFNKEYLEEE